MISSIRLDGSTACMAIEGPTTSEVFAAYVNGVLVPSLSPGDMVILDNLSSHKSAEALALIEGAGAKVLFLPAYSPDLNPIEQAFAKIKHWMRIAQKRTVEDTWRHIGTLVEAIDALECQNYLNNAGYASVKT